MKIEQGLFDHMVLQRNSRNVSDADFAGNAADGVLHATVRKSARAMKGFANIPLGKVVKGKLAASLKGLPAGGPYDVELSIEEGSGGVVDKLTVKDVLVGDVWLLGGQSNMQGIGLLKDAPKPQPLVRAFYMDDRWGTAKEPIHNMHDTVDQVHIDLSGGVRPAKNTDAGVSPGVAFGQTMHELTGVPQGVIACAHGGTSMSQWDPKLKKLGSKSLYGATVRRFKKNGSKVAGVAWYQGCSDGNADAAPFYTKRMRQLVAAMRRDFGKSLPVAIVQIGRVIGWPDGAGVHWNSVQEQQRRLPEFIDNLAVVPAIDLSLDDCIHISGRDQIRVGRRLAEAMLFLKKGQKAAKPPITIKKTSIKPHRGQLSVIVELDNVAGELQSGSRPTGFTVTGANVPSNCVYDVRLSGKQAIVHTSLPVHNSSELFLHYGYGTEPYCNITDAADRSLPVFGPLPLSEPRALTPFVRTLRVSEMQPLTGKLAELECPDTSKPAMRKETFPTEFCDRHFEFAKHAGDEVVEFYACGFKCSEPMKLALLLGYDGPVKAWMDGVNIFHDPNGTNPACPGEATVPFTAGEGAHEILVALSSNKGGAWGIFLQLERRGVAKRLLKKGAGFYTMPEITE